RGARSLAGCSGSVAVRDDDVAVIPEDRADHVAVAEVDRVRVERTLERGDATATDVRARVGLHAQLRRLVAAELQNLPDGATSRARLGNQLPLRAGHAIRLDHRDV